MPRDPGKTLKRQALRQQGVLNPRSQDVQHELFQNSNFFDPKDLVQVKYEMLRQVGIDGSPSARRRKPSDSPGLRSIRPSLRFSKVAWRGCFQKSAVRAAATS